MRAVETIISAWVAEQERDRVRRRLESEQQDYGTAAPHADPGTDAASQSGAQCRPDPG